MIKRPTVGNKSRFRSPSEGRSKGIDTSSKEVDLVPIMNLFVTIIPMLLSMVVLTTIAYISLDIRGGDASPAGASGTNRETTTEKRITKLELTINNDQGDEFFLFNKNSKVDSLVGVIPAEDFVALAQALHGYRTIMLEDQYKDTTLEADDGKELPIIITPKDNIRFGTFVKAMDLCKNMRFRDIVLLEIE